MGCFWKILSFHFFHIYYIEITSQKETVLQLFVLLSLIKHFNFSKHMHVIFPNKRNMFHIVCLSHMITSKYVFYELIWWSNHFLTVIVRHQILLRRLWIILRETPPVRSFKDMLLLTWRNSSDDKKEYIFKVNYYGKVITRCT